MGSTLGVTTSSAADPSVTKANAATKPSAPAEPSTSADGEWYGWQIMAVDVAGVLSGVAVSQVADFDARDQPSRFGLTGGVWYGVGATAAPAVHYAHGGIGEGVSSFGLRLLAPPTVGMFAFLGNCLGSRFDKGCAVDGFVGGSLVGLAGVSILDAAVLAHERPRPARPARQWYGYQTLVVDGASVVGGVALSLTARDKHGDPLHPALAIWVPGYVVGLFGGPIVHFAHGRWKTGLGSLGLRALAGPVGVLPGLMGYCAAVGGVRNCARAGAMWGLVGGFAVVSVVDAFALAYEPTPQKEAAYTPSISVGLGSIAVSGYLQ